VQLSCPILRSTGHPVGTKRWLKLPRVGSASRSTSGTGRKLVNGGDAAGHASPRPGSLVQDLNVACCARELSPEAGSLGPSSRSNAIGSHHAGPVVARHGKLPPEKAFRLALTPDSRDGRVRPQRAALNLAIPPAVAARLRQKADLLALMSSGAGTSCISSRRVPAPGFGGPRHSLPTHTQSHGVANAARHPPFGASDAASAERRIRTEMNASAPHFGGDLR
jgi:hypothetical protein